MRVMVAGLSWEDPLEKLGDLSLGVSLFRVRWCVWCLE